MPKRTISATLEGELVERIDQAARAQQMSRSRLLEACIHAWFERETQREMEAGYRAQAALLQEGAERAWEAQEALLSDESW